MTKSTQPVGKKVYPVNMHSKPSTIVFCGSASRFNYEKDGLRRNVFIDFVVEDLGIHPTDFVAIMVEGGPSAFAHQQQRPEDFGFLLSQLGRFVEKHYDSAKRIIFIGYQECSYYLTLKHHPDLKDREKHDLPKGAKKVHNMTSGGEIECYYASFTGDRKGVTFERVPWGR